MVIMSVPIVLEDTSNSSSVRLVPGAHIDEIMGEKVHIMMTHVIRNHF